LVFAYLWQHASESLRDCVPEGWEGALLIPVIIMVLFMDVFDTMGTLIGVAEQGGFMENNRLPRAQRALTADAVGTVAGAAIPISGGAGDNLPSETNAIAVAPTVAMDLTLDGDEMKVLAASLPAAAGRSQLTLEGSATEHLNQLMGAAQAYVYYEGQGPANPIAGDTIDTAYLSQSGETAAQIGQVGVLHNNT